MSHAIFHVIPEDVEEEHIAADMQPACMQEHGGDEGEVDGIWCVKWQRRRYSWKRCLRYTMHQRYGVVAGTRQAQRSAPRSRLLRR